jgi:hypothetical protein
VNDLWKTIKENLINRVVAIPEFFKSVFDTVVASFSYLGNKIKVIVADIPIIGKAIDADKATEGAEKALEDLGQSALDMGNSMLKFGLGVDDVIGKTIDVVTDLGGAIADATAESDRYIEAQKRLQLQEAELGKVIAANSLLIANEKLIRDDTTQSIENRIAAAQKITAIIDAESAATIKLQEDKIAEMKIDMDTTNTKVEDKIKLANAEAELSRIQATAATRQRENLMKTTSLNKQTGKEQIADDKIVADAKKAAEKELADYIAGINGATQAARLQVNADEMTKIELLYKQKLISEAAFQLKMAELRDEAADIKAEGYVAEIEGFTDKEKEKMAVAAQYLQAASSLLSAWGNLQDAMMEKELENAGDNEQKKDQIRAEYGEKKKNRAIIGAIIDTASAVLIALASAPPPMSYILAGVSAAMGAIQIATISQQTFEKGGVLNGPKHAQGGIATEYGELEGGEGIINAASMSNPSLRNLASAANTAGGGNDFSTGGGAIELSSGSISAIIGGINNKKVYVVETDITDTQAKVSAIETEALL